MPKVNTNSPDEVLAYCKEVACTAGIEAPYTVAVYGVTVGDPIPSPGGPYDPTEWWWKPEFWTPYVPAAGSTIRVSLPTPEETENSIPMMKSYDDMDNLRLGVLEWLAGIGEYPDELRFIIGEDLTQDLYNEDDREKVLERVVVKTLSWALGRIKGGTNDSGQSKVE